MDTLTSRSTIINSSATALFLSSSFPHPRKTLTRSLSFAQKTRKFAVFASKDEPNLDQWDQMELKFGRMIGEDPKLTLAKIMGRKSNPELSYLEIEKLFDKNKGRAPKYEIEEVPFDITGGNKTSNSLDGVNLVRPVPKKGVKFETDIKPREKEVKKPDKRVVNAVDARKPTVPNVILRKPTVFKDDDDEISSRLRLKPNLSLKMGKEMEKDRFIDMSLLKKPEPMRMSETIVREEEYSGGSTEKTSDAMLLEKPEVANPNLNSAHEQGSSTIEATFKSDDIASQHNSSELLVAETNSPSATSSGAVEENDSLTGLQPSDERSAPIEPSNSNSADLIPGISVEASLIKKPERLDQSVKVAPKETKEERVPAGPESFGNLELENFLTNSPIKEREEADWIRAEDLVKTGGREEVELISCSTKGFVVSFGSLIGFLPYRNLAAKWKFLAFESWLRRKGLDPSRYKQNLGVIRSYDVSSPASSLQSVLDSNIGHNVEGNITADMKLEDLLKIYDLEKLKFLSSFVGQKIKVSVVLADRNSRRLILSIKPKEKEELVEKKRSLMAKLSVGDVVKCCVKKITYFGIFVEVEGVPALIHQTEVSWDSTLDPASFFKIGQIVEAKVHQLDFSMERIFLSLKDIMPDPLTEALEAVVGGNDSLDGRLEVAQADTEWAEVESLMEELRQFDGIQSVSKGRYLLSPGLAPTFQVYMAAMFENQYKLLARSGNRVQEVIVQTSLGKEDMKSAILTCTNRVV